MCHAELANPPVPEFRASSRARSDATLVVCVQADVAQPSEETDRTRQGTGRHDFCRHKERIPALLLSITKRDLPSSLHHPPTARRLNIGVVLHDWLIRVVMQ